MKLSVIIPVYNEKDTILKLIECVNSVPIDKEIIVVDDNSNDGTREMLEKLKTQNLKLFIIPKIKVKGLLLGLAYNMQLEMW